MVQIHPEIYKYRTVNRFLILPSAHDSNLPPCFCSREASPLDCRASRLLNPNNRSLHHQVVRTSFAVGVRQPAGTIHQYLAKFQNIPKRGGTNESSSIEAEILCKCMSFGGIARLFVRKRRGANSCANQARIMAAVGPKSSAHVV
jgi:hypothetical protein